MENRNASIRLALPKGRMQNSVVQLLDDAGIPVSVDGRGYRPKVGNGSASGSITYETKLLKPQNVVEMLASGSRDLGFAGADWVGELGADLVELLDTGMDQVRLVVAAPAKLLEACNVSARGLGDLGRILRRAPVLASEYETIAKKWLAQRLPEAAFIRSYGATEVFPPEDADLILDNCATGSTLEANELVIVETVMSSSTRLYASRASLADPAKRKAAETVVLLLSSVLEARRRVMLEVNVGQADLEALIGILPCLRSPTLSPLEGGTAYAVRVAAPKDRLAELIPEIKRRGGTDIVVTKLSQLVP